MSEGKGPLSVAALLAEARLLVIGGTGFLGKVWLSMLLHRFPEIEHIYLVVRPKGDLDSEARFWGEIVPSRVFDPLRLQHPGPAYEEFLRAKVTPIPGDVAQPFAGISEETRNKLRGRISALVNAAGVVDFNPPLDEALDVNAFGMQSLVNLAQDLGDSLPVLHTSTCYVAGTRTGQVDEVHPCEFPFPRADELEPSHWSPNQEIAECVDVVKHVRHRTDDAFRRSAFLAEARKRLTERGEPTRGSALELELQKVQRHFEEQELSVAGRERANFWGWPNTYTYTKSIGEQVLAGSGLPFAIVRPAVIESSLSYPEAGWNEGITTSAPIMYLAIKGMTGMPAGKDSVLDVVPADMVSAGMILALAELLDGSQEPVYQLGTSDTNPLSMQRLIELTGLYKRKKYRAQGSGNPFVNWLQANYETVPVSLTRWTHAGPGATRDRLRGITSSIRKITDSTRMLTPALTPASRMLESLAKTMDGTARVVDQYLPFVATHNYRFSCANARGALNRVSEDERAMLPWCPEALDWRHYWLEVHVPGVEKHVWPRIEERIQRPIRPLRRHDDLLGFLDEVSERHGHAPALMIPHPDGFSRVSFLELRDRALATAVRLHDQGIRQGDRVFLAGANHPDWAVAYFGILRAGAIAVPLDPSLETDQATTIATTAQARAALLDTEANRQFGSALGVPVLPLEATTAPGQSRGLPELVVQPDDVASILFTSGTTGDPKGVMLTHANFTSLIASLSRVFELGTDDRVLSVLPLHHTFEFTCGLLLPLSRGTRVVYLDEISSDRLSATLRDARITTMVGVPALWQLLERRMLAQVTDRGPVVRTVFDAG
ncbi:MAG: AMP-binding protein, partial [Myxococcota bacterium]|nr:AMP-binding protein [Myxococcota bacterium]